MPGRLRGQLEEARKRREVEQRELMRQEEARARGDMAASAQQRILIVGPCASGKSALVEILRENGYNAHAAAQEHSHVPSMWLMNNPSHLIFLEVNIETIKTRRNVSWGEEFLQEELHRLAHAHAHADLIIDTNVLTLQQVGDTALEFLQSNGHRPV